MKRIITQAGVAAVLCTCGVLAHAQITFTDVSDSAGLSNELYYSESLHSLGVVWFDFDSDGWPDILATNGFDHPGDAFDGTVPHLYRNLGNGLGFELVDQYLPALPNLEYVGARVADYDADGDTDVYLYTAHEVWSVQALDNPADGPRNYLLKNLFVENGGAVSTPNFTEAAEAAGIDDCPATPLGPDYGCYQSRTAAFLDYDRDGCVDLYVGHIVMNQPRQTQNRDSMYRQIRQDNACTGTFEDATDQSLIQDDPAIWRSSLVAVAGHLDSDLWPDIYIGNVGGEDTGLLTEDYNDVILRNAGDGTFVEVFPGHGDDTPAAMGIDFGDLNLDGTVDIYLTDARHRTITHDPGNTLYLQMDGVLTDNIAIGAGVDSYFSWGTHFLDADNDGDLDLFVGVGSTPSNPTGHDFSEIYENTYPVPGLVPVGVTVGLTTTAVRGSAMADYDDDGDLDILVVNQQGQLQLFRNDTSGIGDFLKVRLEPSSSNADAFGTRVEVLAGGRAMMRELKGGTSSDSQDFDELHFGLGSDSIDQVTISWPSGQQDVFMNVARNSTLVAQEGIVPPPPNEPDIGVSPLSLDFGAVQTGRSADQDVTISNSGTQVLTVTDLASTHVDFTVVQPVTPFDVAASGGVQNVTVRFAPGADGPVLGDLNITSNDPDEPVTTVPLSGSGSSGAALQLRINAGGQNHTDVGGNLFVADKEITQGDFGHFGGDPATVATPVSGTTDDALYQSLRGAASFSYVFDAIPNGDYDVTLHFNEPFASGPGQRVFDVAMEDVVVIDDLDVFASAGGNSAAHSRTVRATVADGRLNIRFTAVAGQRAMVSAISVVSVVSP
jgi:hypothetical protein